MSDQLKKFVTKHRQEFDSIDPPKGIWDKIDAGMASKNTASGIGKYLSMFIYVGFGLSILALTVYLDRSSNPGSQVTPTPIIAINSSSNMKVEDQFTEDKSNSFIARPSEISQNVENKELIPEIEVIPDTITMSSAQLEEDEILEEMTEEQFAEAEEEETEEEAIAKKEPVSVKSKRLGVYIPEDPEIKNTYTGTLYDASSICAMLRAYKFPGKVENSRFKKSKGNGNFGTGAKLKTISCSNLQRRTSMNAVWLKGLAGKKLKLSLKSGFKNVYLVNRNGEKINPIAISHYFKGLNVITYVGKNLDLVFKDKVELLLFFKKVEVGDKIMIDGKVQTIVKEQPLR